jgi:hypothetical protein
MAEFTRAAVTDFGPANAAEARKHMHNVAWLVIHTVKTEFLDLERRIVFDRRNVDGYFAVKLAHMKSGPVVRMCLIQVSSELHVFDTGRRGLAPRVASRTIEPYAPERIVRLRSQGATRSNPERRHNWMVLVAFAAGCGLTSAELVALRRDDVYLFDTHVEVHVTGDKARRIVCAEEWEDDLRELVRSDLITDRMLVTKSEPSKPSAWVCNRIRDMAGWDSNFSIERLRSTFIVNHLNAGTSALHLLGLLGVTQFWTIQRLLPYANARPVDDVIDLLRIPRQP